MKSKGKIVSVTSSKGGVGKSILTLNLAYVYGKLGKKVLVIDLDLYNGAIATYVNSSEAKTIFNLIEDLSFNRYDDLNKYLFSYNDMIDIIAAPIDPREASKIDSKYIPWILDNVSYKYDVILLDTCSILNEINITCLDSSNSILYVLTNDLFDLKNSKSFFSIISDTGFDNVYTVLNEACCLGKNYFSYYDIRNIIKRNIDFTISKFSNVRNIDRYLVEGKILLENKNLSFPKKDIAVLNDIANTLLKGSDK